VKRLHALPTVVYFGALFTFFGAAAIAAEKDVAPKVASFEMREVSAFEKTDYQSGRMLTRGQYATCSNKPDKEVKAYPKLQSKHPLYGKVKFIDDRKGKGIEYHFVLDQSGEKPAVKKAEEPAGEKPGKEKEQKSLLKQLADQLLGENKPAAKKSLPPKDLVLSKYDRLYFDLNHNLDLTDDPVLKPMRDPPWQALPPWSAKEKMVFDYLDVAIDYGHGIGVRPFRIMPWLTSDEYQGQKSQTMHFVATTAREGRIRLGKHEFLALLGQPYVVTGRYDLPGSATAIYLTPLNLADNLLKQQQYSGFTAEMLCTLRKVDGDLYSITASPLGDKLTVKPYRGDFGVFKIGPGDRKIKDIKFGGSLESETALLDESAEIGEFKAPVGDYLPQYIYIQYGPLRISLSNNYHSEGKPQKIDRDRTFFIKIRKDKPYVLDFSNKPEVLFASPAKGKSFKPGEEVSVKAVLIDPQLDIMIRRLSDSRHKEKKMIDLGEGKSTSYEQELSLDPTVTITDSAGKTIAEGPMPFG
jgi:hypothetical protein